MPFVRYAAAVLLLCTLAPPARAQRAGGYQGLTPAPPPSSQPAPAYETVVTGSPMWTQDRNFLGTRFWKLDPGKVELELWWRPEWYRGDEPSRHRTQLELELGLTKRLQLDIYQRFVSRVDGGERNFSYEGTAIELRVAIPERYGQMWGNPVIYLELLSNHDAPDRVEAKLLLGGQLFTPKLLGAVNLTFECNVDKMKGAPYQGAPELGATAAASYEIIAQRMRLGAEARLIFEREQFRHATTETSLMLGPNVSWHLIGHHLKLYATLFFGVTEDSPRFAPWVILASGW
ncbi:MAG TPA: hypothetical protein VGQ83_01875 [Polyangia bacterium]|jgi:hypothetical protein